MGMGPESVMLAFWSLPKAIGELQDVGCLGFSGATVNDGDIDGTSPHFVRGDLIFLSG